MMSEFGPRITSEMVAAAKFVGFVLYVGPPALTALGLWLLWTGYRRHLGWQFRLVIGIPMTGYFGAISGALIVYEGFS